MNVGRGWQESPLPWVSTAVLPPRGGLRGILERTMTSFPLGTRAWGHVRGLVEQVGLASQAC